MNSFRKLMLSAAIAAAATGSLQASEAKYPPAPNPDQEFTAAQQQAFEAQRKSYLQAMAAQQKAMSEYVQQMHEQQQAFIEAQREAMAQQQIIVPPQAVTPYGIPSGANEWAEAQRKAMETQREEIEKQMRSAMEQHQAFMDAQRDATIPAQEFINAPTPAFTAPYFDVQQDAFDKERKAYIEAMQAQRKEIEKQMQKMYEERQAAFEAQRKAFEERRRTFAGPLALSTTAE